MPGWLPYLILVIVAALLLRALLGPWRQRRRLAYIESYAFPRGLEDRLLKRYPQLDAERVKMAVRALREFFVVACEARGRQVAMPSQGVDALWHEFILFTRNYQAFCRDAFGRFLHHTPAEVMGGPATREDAIRRSWRLACRREGIDPREPDRLPLLFALDGMLGIPDGFTYEPDCRDERGWRSDHGSAVYCGSHLSCSGGGDGDSHGDGGDGDGGGDGGGCGGD